MPKAHLLGTPSLGYGQMALRASVGPATSTQGSSLTHQVIRRARSIGG